LFDQTQAAIEREAQVMMPFSWCSGKALMALIAIVAGSLLACGGPWRDRYFDKGIDRLTQDEVSERMGPPHTAKTPVLGGDTIWTFRVPVSDDELDSMDFTGLTSATKQAAALMGTAGDGPKPTLYCYRYTLAFNEQKILKQWKREECIQGTRNQLKTNE
jgi:hypothetical protein